MWIWTVCFLAQAPHIQPKTIVEQPKHVDQRTYIKHKSETHHVHHEDYPNVGYYQEDSNDVLDGISKTPTGAILSVSVGKIGHF